MDYKGSKKALNIVLNCEIGFLIILFCSWKAFASFRSVVLFEVMEMD